MQNELVSLRTLIIDDSDEDRSAYRRYLSKCAGFNVEFLEAETLEEGIECFEQEAPDCILLDYSLPDGDGMEFLGVREASSHHGDSILIFLTEFGNEELVVKALSMGADDYLPKRSVGEISLTRAVRSAFERWSLRRELAREHAEKDQVIAELREALEEVKRLSGLLPICSHCKNIRKDDGYWEKVEKYFSNHTGTTFTHGICPECMREHYGVEDGDGY